MHPLARKAVRGLNVGTAGTASRLALIVITAVAVQLVVHNAIHADPVVAVGGKATSISAGRATAPGSAEGTGNTATDKEGSTRRLAVEDEDRRSPPRVLWAGIVFGMSGIAGLALSLATGSKAPSTRPR